MNFDDLLGKLMPLFEKKMDYMMEMGKRAMSLEEKKEASKTDLEYRKLEAQVTSDKDKLKWEKEKLTTAVKGEYDLQGLKNSGLLDTERLKGLNEREKQEIMETGANSRAKLSAETDIGKAKIGAKAEVDKAYLSTLGTILGHAVEVSQTGLDGQSKTTKPTKEVTNAARSLMEQTGLATPAATPQGRNVAGEAEFAAGILREHEKNGTSDQARTYLNNLPADTRQATMALLNPGAGATPGAAATTTAPAVKVTSSAPATAIPPITPAVETRTPVPLPDLNKAPTVSDAARPAVQPTLPAPVATSGRSIAATPAFEGKYGTLAAVAPVVPGPGAPSGATSFMDNYGAGIRQRLQATKKTPEEEERARALRRARGLTVGGIF